MSNGSKHHQSSLRITIQLRIANVYYRSSHPPSAARGRRVGVIEVITRQIGQRCGRRSANYERHSKFLVTSQTRPTLTHGVSWTLILRGGGRLSRIGARILVRGTSDKISKFLWSRVLQWRRQNFGSGGTFRKNVLTVYPRIMAHLRIVAQSEGTVDIQIVQSRIIAHSRIITAINNF